MEDGRSVLVARLFRCVLSPDWARPEASGQTASSGNDEFEALKVGDFIAVTYTQVSGKHVHVAYVTCTFSDQPLVKVTVMYVPTTKRGGPWQARRWCFWEEVRALAGPPVPCREVLQREAFLCKVSLCEGALDHGSLESLARLGVPVGLQHRHAALPAR